MVYFDKNRMLYVFDNEEGNRNYLTVQQALQLYRYMQNEDAISDCNYMIEGMSDSWDDDLEYAPDGYQTYKKLITAHPDWEKDIVKQIVEKYKYRRDYSCEYDNNMMEDCFFEIMEDYYDEVN